MPGMRTEKIAIVKETINVIIPMGNVSNRNAREECKHGGAIAGFTLSSELASYEDETIADKV